MFDPKGRSVPCVGVSLPLQRFNGIDMGKWIWEKWYGKQEFIDIFLEVSIGIERLFSIMETNLAKQQKAIRTVDTQV